MEWMSSSARDSYIDNCIARYNEYLLRRNEIFRSLSAAEELKEDGDAR